MKQHFVTFQSPGTFVHEETEKPIDSWDVEKAKDMARKIKERHGATPFAFYFTTRSRTEKELDSKVTQTSCTYFLGGKVETLEEVKARNLSDESVLRLNMEMNNIKKILVNTNSCKVTVPLRKGDVVLDWEK